METQDNHAADKAQDGPLFAVFNGHYWDVSVGPHDYSQCVGNVHRNSALGQSKDDARQIAMMFAAAPDLLSAARAIIDAHDGLFNGTVLMQNGKLIDHTALNEAARLAHRAVRKATGQ